MHQVGYRVGRSEQCRAEVWSPVDAVPEMPGQPTRGHPMHQVGYRVGRSEQSGAEVWPPVDAVPEMPGQPA